MERSMEGMKARDEEWHPGPDFGPPPPPGREMPIEEQEAPKDEPTSFRLMRRIEYTGRIHHMAFRSILQEDGLPPAQASALRFIIRTPGMSQRELADQLHIQRATVTVMLQKMERAGYVDRRPDPMDQRISRIYPTEMAIAQDEEGKRSIDGYFADVFQGFSTEEQQLMDNMLTRLGANIRGILEATPDRQSKE